MSDVFGIINAGERTTLKIYEGNVAQNAYRALALGADGNYQGLRWESGGLSESRPAVIVGHYLYQKVLHLLPGQVRFLHSGRWGRF
jgi:hypothetical protein